MENTVAVIDLGSNAVRMSVNKIKEDGSWDKLFSTRETVRLGEGMGVDRMLKKESMERVCVAVKRFVEIAKTQRCESIAAVATAAVRYGANRDIFLRMVKKETGIDFAVLSGEVEAHYAFLAAKECNMKDMLLFDTGGGSTEIVLVKNNKVEKSISLPLGAVLMTEEFDGRPQSALYRYVSGYISSIEWIDEAQGLPLCGIGGSARALGKLIKKGQAEDYEIHNMDISASKITAMYVKILSTPKERRGDIDGMERDRKDIIMAGITPLKALMDITGAPKMRVCAYGVKEGVFFRMRDEILKRRKK